MITPAEKEIADELLLEIMHELDISSRTHRNYGRIAREHGDYHGDTVHMASALALESHRSWLPRLVGQFILDRKNDDS